MEQVRLQEGGAPQAVGWTLEGCEESLQGLGALEEEIVSGWLGCRSSDRPNTSTVEMTRCICCPHCLLPSMGAPPCVVCSLGHSWQQLRSGTCPVTRRGVHCSPTPWALARANGTTTPRGRRCPGAGLNSWNPICPGVSAEARNGGRWGPRQRQRWQHLLGLELSPRLLSINVGVWGCWVATPNCKEGVCGTHRPTRGECSNAPGVTAVWHSTASQEHAAGKESLLSRSGTGLFVCSSPFKWGSFWWKQPCPGPRPPGQVPRTPWRCLLTSAANFPLFWEVSNCFRWTMVPLRRHCIYVVVKWSHDHF